MTYTAVLVASGCALVGSLAAVLGCFVFLRRQSLLGDAISHCALPGIVIGFLIVGGKSLPAFLVGASMFGLLGAFFVLGIVRIFHLKDDTALGIVLAVFFGFGLVLLSGVQRMPNASKSGMDAFLFGQAATMLTEDIITIGIVGAASLILLAVFWKEWKLVIFDRQYATSLGWPVVIVEMLLLSVVVITVVLGLQAVGVVLMSALVVAPASAVTRQWTNRYTTLLILSGVIGGTSGWVGGMISGYSTKIPTGPIVVIFAASIVLISIAFGRERGIVWARIRALRQKASLKTAQVLIAIHTLAERHQEAFRSVPIRLIDATVDHDVSQRGMADLRDSGAIEFTSSDSVRLTDLGLQQVTQLREDLNL